MQCPKCTTDNPESFTYCERCHAPLKYTCPACKHVQLQGGRCEKCGVDFAKYAAMMVFQAKDAAEAERQKPGWHPPVWAHIVFFPIPSLIVLTLYIVRRVRGK
jgi:hypothetical protein